TNAIKAASIGKPYAISYGGKQDLQYAADVAQTFIRCLVAPFSGAKSYNLRGAVVDIAEFHRTLCEIEPKAKELITFGDRQLAIAYNLDDSALERDLGPMRKTSLTDGIRQTLEMFCELHWAGRLDLEL